MIERGWRTQAGKAWTTKAVLTVPRNRAYLGEIYYHGTWHSAPDGPHHPPLVDPEVFARAGQILRRRSREYATRASNGSMVLLSGLLTCPSCGKAYLGTSGGSADPYRYYACTTRLRHGAAACGSPRLPAAPIEQAIADLVVETLATGADSVTYSPERCSGSPHGQVADATPCKPSSPRSRPRCAPPAGGSIAT